MIGRDLKQYTVQGFQDDLREDGRSCRDVRPIKLALGVLQQCSGSARCSLGNTDVLVGVKVGHLKPLNIAPSMMFSALFKRSIWNQISSNLTETIIWCQAEIGVPLEETPDCGGLQVTVECSPCAGPSYQASLRMTLRLYILCMHTHWLDPARVQPSSVAYVQGRSGEELGVELTKSLERYLKPGRSGKGTLCHASQDCGSISLSSILHYF